eukprot:625030-Amphidinium_carterae.1
MQTVLTASRACSRQRTILKNTTVHINDFIELPHHESWCVDWAPPHPHKLAEEHTTSTQRVT